MLFSHGFSDNLAQFKDRAEELVSHGYVVASVDHFDTTATWLPQYGWLQGENRTDVPGLHDRVRDLEFILDQLAAWDVNDPLFGQRLDLKNVAVTGFSWGGMTAAEFCRRDPRVRAAVLLDAGGTSLTSRIDKPFMHLRAANNSSTTFFNAAATDAIWFQLAGSVHLSFEAFYWFENPVGNRAPEEISLTQRAYLLSFLDHYLKEKATSLHKGPSADWPRVINYRSK